MRQPVRAALASYPTGAPAMFVSHVLAMPLHMQARGGRACIVSVLLACLPGMFRSSPAVPLHAPAAAGRACIASDWCSCHVCQPCFSNAFAHASSWWPCVHRIGAPGMFTRHGYVTPSNAFACASQCGPRLHRIRLVLLPCLSAMFPQCLCTCEVVVAVCASYRCSRHVYQACLGQAQQCLCSGEPVRAALASYPIGAPAMFVSHVSAMPLRMRARGGRVCIVSVLPACLPSMFKSSPAFACASQCGPRWHRIRLVLLPCLSAMFQQCLCACELVVAVRASYRCSRHMFSRHVYVTASNAFACASQCGPRLHRIRLVLLPCLSAMFPQCLCTCEPVVAVCASYRCSRHVSRACLSQAQQCLCLREPVRAALASYIADIGWILRPC